MYTVGIHCTNISTQSTKKYTQKDKKEHKEIGLESRIRNLDIIYGVT